MNEPDLIVIGTGFGGSIVAARAAKRGLKVLVLERGPWWGSGGKGRSDPEHHREFPRTLNQFRKSVRNVRWAKGGKSRTLMLSRDGLYEYHAFKSLDVITGSGVGGGSLIYTSIMEPPSPDYWEGYPAEITAASMQPYYDLVHGMLRPRPMPDRPEKNAVFEAKVSEAGLGQVKYPDVAIAWGRDAKDPERVKNAAGVEQTTCSHCGMCVAGCDVTAKTTMDLTYIPMALAHGAEVKPLCEAVTIGPEGRGYYVRYLDHTTGREETARAARVAVAAGGLNTQRLLFGARDRFRTLPNIPQSLGQRFSPNTDMGSLIYGSDALTDSTYGAAFNSFLPQSENGRYRFLVAEVGMPLGETGLPGFLRKRFQKSILLLGMGRDASSGTIRFDGEGLVTDTGRSMDPGIYGDMEAVMDRIAKAYGPRRTLLNAPAGRGKERVFTVHPLGGCAIGRDASDGVVDHTGQVFGYPGLYVADGSLYRKAPGVPPSFTIGAFAERIASLMA